METLLEQQRRLHEESDRLTDAMRKENMSKKTTLREQINADQKTRFLLDRKMEVAHKLLELYDDRDGLRREEVQAIAGPDEFKEFYKRLNDVKEFHRKHPDEVFVPMSVEFAELDVNRDNPNDETNNLVEFTDEESYGRFLDLHRQHMLYLNLKGATKFNYVQYLDHFDKLFEFPRDKKNNTYKAYVDDLLAYLISYIDRVNPLLDLHAEYGKIKESFDRQWAKNEFPGWGKEAGSAMAHIGAHLDVSVFSSSEELASLGLDRLKSALLALGLKCGGTLEERAARLFSTKGKELSELDPSLFSKVKGAKGKKSQAVVTRERATAFVEAQIYHLVEMVGEQRQATRENVQRRQARTDTEREDDEDEVVSDSDSDDNDDEIIYNPKNLPLGWDGKPIPYWLYKLHGLNINYSCEICGNQVYRGPKAFQRHFSEWRHAHGMRCLGIPNTAHFANVTKIEDAMALWSKIKEMKLQERWNPDNEEEFEDSAGNVVSKKTYEDLKRQGLL